MILVTGPLTLHSFTFFLGVTTHTLSRASFSNRGNEELREAKQFVKGYGL